MNREIGPPEVLGERPNLVILLVGSGPAVARPPGIQLGQFGVFLLGPPPPFMLAPTAAVKQRLHQRRLIGGKRPAPAELFQQP